MNNQTFSPSNRCKICLALSYSVSERGNEKQKEEVEAENQETNNKTNLSLKML